MEVYWRKCFQWVAINRDLATGADDDDVVVDMEIGIVEILVLASDVNRTTILKRRLARTEAVEAPHWSSFEW